jgi:Catalytic LigB subunit of aromatic ring-opening dioxygenase
MAEIVLGIATSHGPMLSTPPDQWWQRAEADRTGRTDLWFQGKQYPYQDLVEVRSEEGLKEQITPEMMKTRHEACQKGIAALAETFERVAPDVAIIIGDDQEELFFDDNMPAFSVYWGDTVENRGPSPEDAAKQPPGIAVANWGHFPPEPTVNPCEPKLALHMIETFMNDGFDVAHSRRLPPGRHKTHSIPHAYGFVYRRIMNDEVIPNVPVFINTFYPPNQPTLRRSYDFGESMLRAIESWESDKRVAVIASGGLTHFVIEEDLDQDVLAAMTAKDVDRLTHLPAERFNAGTSEIRNWIAASAVMNGTKLNMEVLDYVPCYRSEAGTGNAMCFAQWV